MTLVEFLNPLKNGRQSDLCLATLYYQANYASSGPMTTTQIRTALQQARIKGAKTMNVPRALNSAGHLVDVTNAFKDERVWKLTASGEEHVRTVLGIQPIRDMFSDAIPVTDRMDSQLEEKALVHRVIVELDLSRYSDIARILEESLGAEAVAKLNDQIEKLVETALQTVEAKASDTRLAATGD